METTLDCLGWATGQACSVCYVCHLVEVCTVVKQVLRDEGTLWLNLGDGYAHDGKWGGETSGKQGYLDALSRRRDGRARRKTGRKPKDLCGIPWRVALAPQADGWTLRQDIVFAKQNPLPESVKDRCTQAHEYLFLLTKKPSYYGGCARHPGACQPQDPSALCHRRRAAYHRTEAQPQPWGE